MACLTAFQSRWLSWASTLWWGQPEWSEDARERSPRPPTACQFVCSAAALTARGMPQASIDPVVMAAATVMRLQTVVSREVAATEAAVVTVGVLQAGMKENVIPTRPSSS